MTGETLTDEKHPQSPASSTGTDATLSGDAIIEIAEDDGGASPRPSSQRTRESSESAQPRR